MTPWRLAIEEILADGEWHPVEEVKRRAAASVPPGKAHRCAVAETVSRRARRGVASSTPLPNDDQLVVTGARIVIKDLVANMVRRGACERDGDRLRRVTPTTR